MDALSADEVFLFEGFRLDRRTAGLFRADENGVLVPVVVGSRALDLLILLVGRHGDLVSKDEIMTVVWPGMIVEDSNLPTQISALRRVLDQQRSNGSCIQTVAGRGYRFVAAITHPAVEARWGRSPTISNGAQGEDRRPEPVLPLAIEGGERSRSLRYVVSAAASIRRLAEIPAPVIAAVVAITLILAVGAWQLWPTPKPGPVAVSIPQRPVAPRLSIVVLPFANLGNDPEQQYFADGITEDLTTDLSRIADMFVISRNTALTYRAKPVNSNQIGRELGVRYVLEGSVQRSGSHVRLNAQLIEAETNGHLWAERFDRDTADLIALQDDLTRGIAGTLKAELITAEAARPTEQPDALDFIFRGRAAGLKPWSRGNYDEAIRMFQRALELNPYSTEAQNSLVVALTSRVLGGVANSPAADIARAEELVEQALAASPRSSHTHFAKGQVLRAQHRYAEAIPQYETAIVLDRNFAGAVFALGLCKLYNGSIEETILLEEQAIRLSPRDPQIGLWYHQIGRARLLQSRADEAIPWFEKSRGAHPGLPFIRADIASALGLKGETERAAIELAEARRLGADDRYASIARLKASGYLWAPKIYAVSEATYFVGMRNAGMPEE